MIDNVNSVLRSLRIEKRVSYDYLTMTVIGKCFAVIDTNGETLATFKSRKRALWHVSAMHDGMLALADHAAQRQTEQERLTREITDLLRPTCATFTALPVDRIA